MNQVFGAGVVCIPKGLANSGLNRGLVGQDHFRDRQVVFLRVRPQLFHRCEGVLRWIFLRRRAPFPFNESSTDRVVLLFKENLGSGQELAGSRSEIADKTNIARLLSGFRCGGATTRFHVGELPDSADSSIFP